MIWLMSILSPSHTMITYESKQFDLNVFSNRLIKELYHFAAI